MDSHETVDASLRDGLPPLARAGSSAEPVTAAPVQGMSMFLDVDGTLVDFAAHPDAIRIDGRLQHALLDMHQALGGAMAIVSGRSIDDLTRLFDRMPILLVGHHGASWRPAQPGAPSESRSPELPAQLRERVVALAASLGAWVENKRLCLAVHHPDDAILRQRLIDGLAAAAEEAGPQWTLMTGRLVVEVKPQGVDKGSACRRLLAVPPFAGTVPVAFGDDITDLDMFQVIDACDGSRWAWASGWLARPATMSMVRPR